MSKKSWKMKRFTKFGHLKSGDLFRMNRDNIWVKWVDGSQSAVSIYGLDKGLSTRFPDSMPITKYNINRFKRLIFPAQE